MMRSSGSGVDDDDDDERKEPKCSTNFKTCTPPPPLLNKWMRNRQKHATTKHSKLTYFRVFQ